MNNAQLKALRDLVNSTDLDGITIRRSSKGTFEVWENNRFHGEMNSYESAMELVGLVRPRRDE